MQLLKSTSEDVDFSILQFVRNTNLILLIAFRNVEQAKLLAYLNFPIMYIICI